MICICSIWYMLHSLYIVNKLNDTKHMASWHYYICLTMIILALPNSSYGSSGSGNNDSIACLMSTPAGESTTL